MIYKSLRKCTVMLATVMTPLLALQAHATIDDYSQNFESMAVGDGSTILADDGWMIGANVYDGAAPYPGASKFFYGLFGAPNGGAGFSSVATGDATNGGIGVNYLNIYSDYNCCGLGNPSPEGHGNGTDVVNALVLRQYNITSDDLNSFVTFNFDAKRPEVQDDGFGGDDSAAVGNGCSGICTAQAFVKTLDPGAGFSTTNLLVEDMTAIPQGSWTTYSITIELSDPALEGQLLQVGFETFASNFDNTGVYYDNISLSAEKVVNVPVPGFAVLMIGALLAMTGIVVSRQSR